MKNKGFTLVELLAVIAILAILVIIALPNVIKLYNNAKKNSFLTEAKTVYSEVSKKYISESIKGNKLSYVNSEDNTKLEMNGNKLKYCIQLDNNGNITAMKVGNDNYYIFYDGSKEISKLDISDISEGKYVQNKCDANTTITKDGTTPKPTAKACTYDGDINAGDAIQIGIYTYHYKQDYVGSLELSDSSTDTFNVELTDKESTDAVTEAPCSSINGKLVTSMARMFYNSKVPSIDLSNFNTSNVTNMMGMFAFSQATTLDLSSFDTSNVTDMGQMFAGSKATTLDLSNFRTSKVTDMIAMFYGSEATTLDLSRFDTSKVTDMSEMFEYSKATVLNLNNFDTSNVTNMGGMFIESAATTLDLSSFNTSKVTNMGGMFYGSSQLKTIYASDKFNTLNVTESNQMFDSVPNLVGGAGTAYDSSKTDKTYARIDGGTSNPGYFTLKTN